MSVDLALVPVNELVDEVMKRGETAIIVVLNMGPEKLQYINWVGEYHAALGCCVDMQRQIIEDSHEQE